MILCAPMCAKSPWTHLQSLVFTHLLRPAYTLMTAFYVQRKIIYYIDLCTMYEHTHYNHNMQSGKGHWPQWFINGHICALFYRHIVVSYFGVSITQQQYLMNHINDI